MMEQPLADRMRPQKLEQVVGQAHILGEGKLLQKLVKAGKPFSLIFWGPPGSGKTTLARIIASEMKADFVEISAVMAGKADVTKVVERARRNEQGDTTKSPARTVLFVDEIHRFNKAQQDAFLPHVESGLITLIGATTENPSFEVISPLLSRSRVIVLEPLAKKDVISIIKRAAKTEKIPAKRLPDESIDLIAELSGGDGRIALNTLEMAMQLTRGKIAPAMVEAAAQARIPGYDKLGEYHYNLISAFIKSLRGSQPTAALYYMARMLQAGEDPKFIARRMVIFASEDIGLAAPAALNLAVSTFLAVERIGMPECQFNLFQCATVMAKAPKSREITGAMLKALAAGRDYPDLPVPLHLRNAPTKLMQDLGYQKGYKWQSGFKHKEGFLPPELAGSSFFD
ncbi:TPA: AAA family ATPase [Candidatus Saccharibacteria bacterium]|nr:MAG: AAA family ATPase [Candidatus Saccharibacteria bacterium RIFCSPHIGHO2_12_FULL_47_17]HCM51886.1 AAA family ATPase [Candidatus Saccharibacteria bacterium]